MTHYNYKGEGIIAGKDRERKDIKMESRHGTF